MDLNPPRLWIECKIIPIDTIKNIGANVVRKILALSGIRKPINEKHAGHTPIIKPITEPVNPDFPPGFILQSVQFFLEYR